MSNNVSQCDNDELEQIFNGELLLNKYLRERLAEAEGLLRSLDTLDYCPFCNSDILDSEGSVIHEDNCECQSFFDQTPTQEPEVCMCNEPGVCGKYHGKGDYMTSTPEPENPADNPANCLACMGPDIDHTCVPEAEAPKNYRDYPPEMVTVRLDDLQTLGDASGWDCDEETYNRIKAAMEKL